MAIPVIECDGCGKRIRDVRRYPIAPLANVMGESLNSACLAIGVSGTTMQDARCHGITRRNADNLAGRAEHHPYSIWPEMVDDDIADHSVPCEECGDPFVPTRGTHRFCTKRCQNRQYTRERQRRMYQTDPGYREHRRQANRVAYHESVEYYRAAERRRYWKRKTASDRSAA